MIEIKATYYDGQSAAGQKVRVSFFESGDVEIHNDAITIKTSLQQIRISERIANSCRHIYLADGGKLETDDNESIDAVAGYFERGLFYSQLHMLESRWSYVLAALIATIILCWAAIEYGVPLAAKWTAKSLPAAFEKKIGEQGLVTLDELFFNDSKLDPKEIQRLQARFDEVSKSFPNTKGKKYLYQLKFRSSAKLGANALALPGGIIIATDGLVDLADNDDELLAVLAHEAGHIENQHGLRSIFQDSITTLFVAMLLGDVTSITTLSASLPVILVETRYSRKFEREADRFAVRFLLERQIPVEMLSSILVKLTEQNGDNPEEFSYLSTHPATEERIKLIKQWRDEYNG